MRLQALRQRRQNKVQSLPINGNDNDSLFSAIEPKLEASSSLRKAFQYQQDGIEHLRDKERIALFWEMRLGKSLVTLRWLRANNVKRALIVCPLSVIPSWENECRLEEQSIVPIRSSDKNNGLLNLYANKHMTSLSLFAVTNYEAILSTDIHNVKKYNWEAVVLDEATTIRRPQSQISQICTSHIWENVKYKAILTGTPVPESIIDIYQQCKFLFGQFMGHTNYFSFKTRYFYQSGGGKYRGNSATGKGREASLEPFSTCLTRKEVGIQCEKLYSRRTIDFTKEYRKHYDTLEATYGLQYQQGQTNNEPTANTITQTQWAIVVHNWLHQMSGGQPKLFPESRHKLDYLLQLIKNDEVTGKVVIWCHFTKEVEAIVQELELLYPEQVGKIAGDVELNNRAEIIQDFQSTTGKIRFLVCQLRTARMGLDLSAANSAIYYSNSWHRLDRLQSEDRVIHPLKTEPVYVIDLVTKNSIDEDLLASMAEKKQSTDDLLEGAFRHFLKRLNLQ